MIKKNENFQRGSIKKLKIKYTELTVRNHVKDKIMVIDESNTKTIIFCFKKSGWDQLTILVKMHKDKIIK